MKCYIPFGDWSDDGHGKYHNLLVDIPNMDYALRAQERIKAIYGEDFFKGWANFYEESSLSSVCWKALLDHNMPIDILKEHESFNDWSNCNTWEEVFADDSCSLLSLDFIEQAFIWLLNQYGAEIIILPEGVDIPQLNNWTCPGFENVGYGCFDD